MNPGRKREELLDLLDALASQSITPDEHRRLEQLLAEDLQCRQVYFDYMDVHVGLHRWTLCDEEREPLHELWEQLAVTPQHNKRASWLSVRARYALVIAATLCISLVAQFFLVPARQSELGAAVHTDYLATLRRAADCLWRPEDAALREGCRLLPDEIGLRRGVAEILFDSGTQLILEGPATLKIESLSAATLVRGKVVLETDETAEPFVLNTPSARLVNHASQCGALVEPWGEEVHVFDGQVRREPKAVGKIAAQTPPEELAAGNARKYPRAAATNGKPIALATNQFVRQVPQRVAAPRDPTTNLLAYEGFDYPTGTLSAGDFSDVGWAGPWRGQESMDAMLSVHESLVRPRSEEVSVGGSMDFAGVNVIQRLLAVPVRLDQDGVYYFSFLFRRYPGNPKSHGTFLMMFSNARQTAPQKRLALGVAQPGHVAFVNLEGGGVRIPLPLDYEKTYLMVGKIVAGRKTPDQVFLRIYRPDEPVTRREPASWSVVSRPVQSDLAIDTLTVHVNSDSRQAIDEIRLGTTWSSVTLAWVR